MLDPSSRYANVETVTLQRLDPDGRPRAIAYMRRRLIPPAGSSPTLVSHAFAAGERLDTITTSYFGDPTRFWQICDANEVLRPTELTDAVGRRIVVPLPQA
jgi:hypothetical protein